MNRKIFRLLTENLHSAFDLPKFANLVKTIDKDTVLLQLPWTPARLRKFQDKIQTILDLSTDLAGTIEHVVKDLDTRYTDRFFREIWQPNTDKYRYTGWSIVEEITKHSPKTVLDVGCGYNQFKHRIPGVVGIDPYNESADYQVDILDFVSATKFDAMIIFGSINFNSKDEISQKLKQCVDLLANDGRMYFRVNPGISHIKGPWVDIFEWDFKTAQEFSQQFDLILEAFKKDHDRYYFVYYKK